MAQSGSHHRRAPRPSEFSTSSLSVPSSLTRPDPSTSWGPTKVAPVVVALDLLVGLDRPSGLGRATSVELQTRIQSLLHHHTQDQFNIQLSRRDTWWVY